MLVKLFVNSASEVHWQWRHCDVKFSGNVFANSKWSCLLIYTSKVHWRVQPTTARRSGRFSKMHRALHRLHKFLNKASVRTVNKRLKRNNDHLITLQIWMPWRYIWGATHKAVVKPSSEAQNSFWIRSCTGKDTGQFSAGPMNKVVPSFRSSLTGVREGWWKTFRAFFSTQKVSTYSVCAVLNSWDNFW